jgi:DNA invertase Pin-like site-specific DNA recombinase
MATKLIAYYRVSTKQQGTRGLGLESQKALVQAYALSSGGAIDAEYTEVESGKRADRPKLAAALAHARRSKATLVSLAAVAEDEARRISERTKSALSAAKARGTLLGSARPDHWAGREDARQAGAERGAMASVAVRQAKARAAVADLLPEMQTRRAAGESLATIAGALNAAGHRTTRGNDWTAMGVKLVLDRAATN